jgi:hypothetical protein
MVTSVEQSPRRSPRKLAYVPLTPPKPSTPKVEKTYRKKPLVASPHSVQRKRKPIFRSPVSHDKENYVQRMMESIKQKEERDKEIMAAKLSSLDFGSDDAPQTIENENYLRDREKNIARNKELLKSLQIRDILGTISKK